MHRPVVSGIVAAVLMFVSFSAVGNAQNRRKQQRPHHETNASRQARIARTIRDTYSHPWEIAGGGGYLRWRSGEMTRKNNEVSWNLSADYYLTPRLAIVGDSQGSFGHAYQQLPILEDQIPRPQINEYFFTGGANYRFYEKEKVAVSVQATVGTAWGIFSGGAKGLTGPEVGLWQDGFRPAGTASLNVDYNFYPNLALRISPTYVVTDFRWTPQGPLIGPNPPATPTYTSAIQNNVGFNIGVIYRFGRHK